MRACSAEAGSLTPPEPSEREPDLGALEERLEHRFADRALLRLALTHRSRAHEESEAGLGNERLEFLGDAVLDLVVRETLLRRHPEHDEGRLSRARAALVNTRALAARARELELDRWLRLGRGEARSAGRRKASILANVFEAVLGALYLDAGLGPVVRLVERRFGPQLEEVDALAVDAKTRLQEWLQAGRRPLPVYRVRAALGPDHAKEFHVEAWVGDELLGLGTGGSKRAAEQEAARRALETLGA